MTFGARRRLLPARAEAQVFEVTPEEHDREAATVQGLTHLIARVLLKMEPLPTRMTTASFERLMQAVDMVRHDSPAVFHAIERDNPFAVEVRDQFFRAGRSGAGRGGGGGGRRLRRAMGRRYRPAADRAANRSGPQSSLTDFVLSRQRFNA